MTRLRQRDLAALKLSSEYLQFVVRIMAEERIALSVLRPTRFVDIILS